MSARSLPAAPFVLIDDARAEGAAPARLYRDPVDIVRADDIAEVVPALMRLRKAQASGLHAAGVIGYEAGHALEPRLHALDLRMRPGDPPLLWFGLFEEVEEIAPDAVAALVGEAASAPRLAPEPLISRAEYDAAFSSVQDRIVAGDVYQINLTFPCRVAVEGDPAAFYGAVRPHAAAGHGALVFTGDHWLLSFSPEMFFALEQGQLTVRPMKGTAPRDANPARDSENSRLLQTDTKQRAENLMIVDLLRNDLSRIAVPGSVRVSDLFTVETYPTVHQMTSTVTAVADPARDAVDVLMALFPCGSVTGAPKIRAMEIIHEVEGAARGPYTGSIGRFDPSGDAAFNVAIRTIWINNGGSAGTLGLGSAVVADSHAAGEWRECLDKARFLAPDVTGRAGERT